MMTQPKFFWRIQAREELIGSKEGSAPQGAEPFLYIGMIIYKTVQSVQLDVHVDGGVIGSRGEVFVDQYVVEEDLYIG